MQRQYELLLDETFEVERTDQSGEYDRVIVDTARKMVLKSIAAFAPYFLRSM